jgi:hypothetical protein
MMVAAFYWMLFAWVGARWAAATTVAAACWLAASYWSHSFWGGAVAAAGAALVYGALPRLQRAPRVAVTLAFGLGLVILANTRPYEGLLAAIPAMFAVAHFATKRDYAPWPDRLRRLIGPLIAVGLASLALMAIQNYAVTGRWLTSPYALYHREFDVPPLFLWQRPTPHAFENARRAAFEDWGMQMYDGLKERFAAVQAKRFLSAITFLIPVYLLFPLLLIGYVVRAPLVRIALAGVALPLIGLLASVWYMPHYFAPAMAPLAVILACCCRQLAVGAGPWPLFRSRLAGATMILWAVPAFAINVASIPAGPLHVATADWGAARAHLADSVASDGRQHVLFVRYPPQYSPHSEWVFNGASVATQPAIWAHDLGSERNQQLLAHFPKASGELVTVSDSVPFYTVRPLP